MPLKVIGFSISVLVSICSLGLVSDAQSPPPNVSPATPPAVNTAGTTSGDVMRDRISKAKAFIVVRNYNAAIFELENIRRESADAAVHSVANVLLMSSYLEQGDFKRAQDLLNDLYTKQKTSQANAAANYKAAAAQVNSSARARADRYRVMGLSVTDRTLPLEALNDLEKMRETLELVVTQANEIAKDPKRTTEAMAIIEEAGASRGMLARDDYDTQRWRDTVADSREVMVNGRNTILDAIADPQQPQPVTEQMTQPVAAPPVTSAVTKPIETAIAETPKPAPSPIVREREVRPVATEKPEVKPAPEPAAVAAKEPETVTPTVETGPLVVGSLVNYATTKPQPVYSSAARSAGARGVVRVDVIVDENGQVSEINGASGHSLLQAAAKDAIKRWRFRPFMRDGQPVRASGFVSFNFAM